MIFGAYCVGKVHNMLPWRYYDKIEHIVKVRYTICYRSSIVIFGAYCVGKVHNMLPWWYYENGSILCR